MKTNNAVLALGALAQGSRLKIYRRLVEAGLRGLAAGKLATDLGIPAATLSFHLKELSHAGLISSRRESRSIIYAPDFPAMTELMNFLTENCCRDGQC